MSTLDLFEKLSLAVQKPETKSANTTMLNPIAPAGIGIALDPTLNDMPKQTLAKLGKEFPVNGLEPEQRAQLNMAAKLSAKAASDAEFYADRANQIGGSMARIHTQQVKHKGHMMQHDLTIKTADVTHMGNIEGWQAKTFSLLDKAREKHAGIQLLQAAI